LCVPPPSPPPPPAHCSNASDLRDELGNVIVGTGASARAYGYEPLDVVCTGDAQSIHFGGLLVSSNSTITVPASNRSRFSLMDGTAHADDWWFALGTFENYVSTDGEGIPGPVCAAGTLPITNPATVTKYVVTDVVELYVTMDDFVDPAPKLPDFEWGGNKYW